MLRLTSLSFAHPGVDAPMRAQLSSPLGGSAAAVGRLRDDGVESFFMSTCLRVEIAWLGGAATTPHILQTLYADSRFTDLGALRQDHAAFHHLCRVAAGLDSPVVGEPEVLGQFRRAVAGTRPGESEPSALHHLLESAVGAARASRRLIDEVPRGSLAVVAARHASAHSRVAILGGGAMARAALGNLDGAEVAVFSRRPGLIGGQVSKPWHEALDALAEYPAVISTIPGRTPIFEARELAGVLRRRRRALLLVDLGMPPGFSGAVGHSQLRYLGVDELASHAAGRPLAAAEERIAEESLARWQRMSGYQRAGAVISAVLKGADEAVSDVVQRFSARLASSADPEAVLRQAAHTAVRRALHPAVSYLGSSDPAAVDVVAEMFGIEE